MRVVSTPQNTFTYNEQSNTVRIQDGPSVASFFRLGEFFAGVNDLAEKLDGKVTYSDVVDPTTGHKLLELTLSAPQLEFRSLIDSKTKLPQSIDVVRGRKPDSYNTLKHATRIRYDDVPPDGIFNFTIPAGAAMKVQTLEDPLQNLPLGVLQHCARIHLDTVRHVATSHNISTNTQIYFVDDQFALRRGGFIEVHNDSNEVWQGEVKVTNFSFPNLAVSEAMSGKKQEIRLVQHRLTSPGEFRLYWNLQEALPPGESRYGIYWINESLDLQKSSQGDGYRIRLSNNYGGEAIENFILIVPAGTCIFDYTRPYHAREDTDGYTICQWQRHLPQEMVNNRVDLSLAKAGADYSAEYIEQNRGRILVEIPEVFELANIVIALSEPGLQDPQRVNKRGTYYQKVLEYFLPYKDHPLIAESDVTVNLGYSFRDNSLSYRFDGDRIVHAGQYFNICRPNRFGRHLAHLEHFARISRFRQFYRGNLTFYEQQIQLYRAKVLVRRMWTWLEERFPNRHDCYKVVFSPLVGSSHQTRSYANQGFSETIMFVSGPGESPDTTDSIEQGYRSRTVFTEIDHNYVNSITRDYLDRVNRVFTDPNQWNQQDNTHYPSAEMTFNEYMTWAVFVLYVYDTFEPEEADIIFRQHTADIMIKHRKFPRFTEFTQELLRLYRNRTEGQSIPDLYPAILDWIQNQ